MRVIQEKPNGFMATGIMLILLLAVLALFSSCEEDTPDYNSDIQVLVDPQFGKYLANGSGRPMYVFAPDVADEPQCTEGCLNAWPAVTELPNTVDQGLDLSDFQMITRADGISQVSYKGWPLYYFSGDVDAAGINGDGLGGVWMIAKPNYSIMIGKAEIDGEDVRYLVDEQGNSLYLSTNDSDNESNCSNGCLDIWPIFFKEELVLPAMLNTITVGSFERPDGSNQSTVMLQPVYRFHEDLRGDQNGHLVGPFQLFILDESDS